MDGQLPIRQSLAMTTVQHLSILAALLQICGTALLGWFSLYGVKYGKSKDVYANGKPLTTAQLNAHYLWTVRAGLLLLLLGIAIGAYTGYPRTA